MIRGLPTPVPCTIWNLVPAATAVNPPAGVENVFKPGVTVATMPSANPPATDVPSARPWAAAPFATITFVRLFADRNDEFIVR